MLVWEDLTASACPCHVSSPRPGAQSGPPSAGDACSFSPRLCWTGLTARRGEKLRLVSFVPELQRGSRSLPRLFQLTAVFTSTLIYTFGMALAVWHRANGGGGRGGGGGAWAREDGSHEESVLRGDVRPLASTVKVLCLKICSYFHSALMGNKPIEVVSTICATSNLY